MLYAKVINGALNMREDTNTSATKLTQIPNGTRIAVLEKGSTWAKAVYNEYTGYVMTKYLQFEEEETEEPEQSELVTIVLPRTIAKAVYEALKLSLNE